MTHSTNFHIPPTSFPPVSCYTSKVKSKRKFLYIAVSRPQDCSKHFTLYSLADLFNRTPSQLLREASSHAAIKARMLIVQISTTVCSQVRIHTAESELEQCRVNNLAQRFRRQHRIRTRVFLVESPEPLRCTKSASYALYVTKRPC